MAESSFLQSRPFYAIVALLILILFYIAGPFSAPSIPPPQYATADARLARWIDAEVPQGAYVPQAHAYDPPVQRPLVPSRARTKINLYPLNEEPQVGKPGGRSAAPSIQPEVVQSSVNKVDKVRSAVRLERTDRKKEKTRKPTTRRLRWDAPSSDDIAFEAKGMTESKDVVADDNLDGEFLEEELPVKTVKRRSPRL